MKNKGFSAAETLLFFYIEAATPHRFSFPLAHLL